MVRNGHGTATRTSPPWRLVAIGAAVVLVVGLLAVAIWMATGGSPTAEPPPPARSVYVDPAGSDSNDGSQAAPFQTIQAALEEATPGTTINLAPGSYYEDTGHRARRPARTHRSRSRARRSGKDRSGRYQATVYAASRAVNIDHSYYVLRRIHRRWSGEPAPTRPYPTDLNTIDAFKNSVQAQVSDSRLVYIGSADDVRDVTGVTIRNMFLNGGGGECVRLRNNAHGNTITDSVVQYCGMYGKGGATTTGPSTTTARASTSAPARSRTTSRCTTTTAARTTSSRTT